MWWPQVDYMYYSRPYHSCQVIACGEGVGCRGKVQDLTYQYRALGGKCDIAQVRNVFSAIRTSLYYILTHYTNFSIKFTRGFVMNLIYLKINYWIFKYIYYASIIHYLNNKLKKLKRKSISTSILWWMESFTHVLDVFIK